MKKNHCFYVCLNILIKIPIFTIFTSVDETSKLFDVEAKRVQAKKSVGETSVGKMSVGESWCIGAAHTPNMYAC